MTRVNWYRLEPSDMTVEYEPGSEPEPLESAILTGKPGAPVEIAGYEDSALYPDQVDIYFREMSASPLTWEGRYLALREAYDKNREALTDAQDRLQAIRDLMPGYKTDWLIHLLDLVDDLARKYDMETSSEAQDDLRKLAELLHGGADAQDPGR